MDGGYTVLVPALPGCITYGDTIYEAMEMAKKLSMDTSKS